MVHSCKSIVLLNCVVGLTILNPMPILATLATAPNLSVSSKNIILSQKATVFCDVINIKTGQLALRLTPGGKARAGLNNGNVVEWVERGDRPWVYVQVVKGPNRRINGLMGWVNSDYLSCN
jgi:hypothetical protein